jgi:zinc transport system ATP-binding protein
MDEPTAGVDLASQEVLSQVLARLAERGATMLVVTHELRALRGVLTRIVEMGGGRITLDVTPEEHDRSHPTARGADHDGHDHDPHDHDPHDHDPHDHDPHHHDGHHHDDEVSPPSPAAGPLDHVPGGRGA